MPEVYRLTAEEEAEFAEWFAAQPWWRRSRIVAWVAFRPYALSVWLLGWTCPGCGDRLHRRRCRCYRCGAYRPGTYEAGWVSRG